MCALIRNRRLAWPIVVVVATVIMLAACAREETASPASQASAAVPTSQLVEDPAVSLPLLPQAWRWIRQPPSHPSRRPGNLRTRWSSLPPFPRQCR